MLGDLGAISVTAAGKDADLVQESENLVGLVVTAYGKEVL